MGRILAIGAIVVGAYALWAGQNPGKAFKPSVPSVLFAPSGTPGASIGASAVGVAKRSGG